MAELRALAQCVGTALMGLDLWLVLNIHALSVLDRHAACCTVRAMGSDNNTRRQDVGASEHDASVVDWPCVPEGKVRFAECGSGVPMSPKSVLDDRWIGGAHWFLVRVGRGFVIAGSLLRFTETVYKVTYEDASRGTTHGRSFRSEQDAWDYLAALEDRACREAQS